MRHPRLLAAIVVAPLAASAMLAASSQDTRPVRSGPAAPAQAATASFPDDWYYRQNDGTRYPGPKSIEGLKAPELHLKSWIGDISSTDALKGKVVVVDFWATWCGPCMRAIPKNIELTKKYPSDEFVILGVHDSKSGWQKMPQVAEDRKINYPLAIDVDGKSQAAWKVAFWPTYAVIDHTGVVRAAGLLPDKVEEVVKVLLEERRTAHAKKAAVGS